jgi:hypothetical protein
MANAFPAEAIGEDVAGIINEVLTRRLGRYGFRRAEIRADLDHNGDPALFVEARYRRTDAPVDGRETAGARSEIRRRLLEVGEDRFPYIHNHFAKGQPILGAR